MLNKLKKERHMGFSCAIVLLPFLYQYKGLGSVVSLGEILLAGTTFFELCNDGFKLKNVNKKLLLFYVLSMVSTGICLWLGYFDIGAAMTTGVRMLFYALVIVVARNNFNIEAVEKIYTVLVFAFSVYLLIQYVFHMMTGGYLPIYISSNLQFPPEARPSDLSIYYRWSFRSSSLFLEPGYYVFYVMPQVCILIFKEQKSKFEISTLIITVVAVLFSTASAGIVALVIVFSVYLFGRANNQTKYKFFLKTLILVVAVAGVGVFFNYSDAATLTLARLSNGGSVSSRLTRGFVIFSELPLFHQLFGVGLNNLESYMLNYGMTTLYDEGNLNYVASVVQVLIYTGAIGWLSLVTFFGSLVQRVYKLTKGDQLKYHIYRSGALWAMLYLNIFIMCYEAAMYTYRFAFYMILLESLVKQYWKEKRRDENEGTDDRYST